MDPRMMPLRCVYYKKVNDLLDRAYNKELIMMEIDRELVYHKNAHGRRMLEDG